MFKILNIPEKIRQLEYQLAGIHEFDHPPNFCDFFWSRRQRYAEIALDTFNTSDQLRYFADLPVEEPIKNNAWNIKDELIRIIKEIDMEREKYEEHIKLTTLQFAQNKF
jgi:hypothetical protein